MHQYLNIEKSNFLLKLSNKHFSQIVEIFLYIFKHSSPSGHVLSPVQTSGIRTFIINQDYFQNPPKILWRIGFTILNLKSIKLYIASVAF